MRTENRSAQPRNEDALNQAPYKPKELFSHFTKKPFIFRGSCLKFPVLKSQIAFFFGLAPEKAVARYEKKSLDPNSLEAIRKAADRYEQELAAGGGLPEAAIILEDIAVMKRKLAGVETGQLQSDVKYGGTEDIPHLVTQEISREKYMDMLEKTIAKRKVELRQLGNGPARKLALEALAEGLLVAGRKNKEGSHGAE